MGGNQEPMTPPPAPMTPPPATAPSGPNALDNLMASMSRPELLVLAGGALIVLLEVVDWFIDFNGMSLVSFVGGALAVALVLMRASLPAAVRQVYPAVLFLTALVVTISGLRDVILDVLFMVTPPAGASPAFLLGFLVAIVATGAMGYAVLVWWRGRSA